MEVENKKAAMMRILLRLILAFLLYGMLGWLWESLLGSFGLAHDSFMRFVGLPQTFRVPFLAIYGFGGILLTLMDEFLPNSLALKTVVAVVTLSAFECASGQFAMRYVNKGGKTWDYGRGSTCSGFLSLRSVAAWTVASLLFFVADPLRYVLGNNKAPH